MIIKFLIIATIFTATATLSQYLQPVELNAIGSECALILPGGARSSAYDHTLNLFRVGGLNSIQDTTKTCITYDAVNAAYLDARKRIHVAQPKGEWKTEEIATVGELLLDISIQLARTYGLSYEDIENGLPQIDTSRTLIREVCPPFLSGVECRAGKYRRFDGLCNNLEHPTWGATMTPFQRLIGPLYADGINAPRISVTGHDLPLSRVVSRTIHPDEGFHDHAGTVMVIAWGQFMDHDFTLTGTPLDPRNRNDPEECCQRPLHLKHPYCNEIRIPDDDYFYRLFNVKCIDFVRAFPSPRAGCRLGSRAPFNTLTGVIDGNTIYGVKEDFARKLREGHGGLLRMNPVFQEYGLKDLLPLKLDYPDEGCTRPNKSVFCFEAGEIRVNEQLVLSCMHTLMARNHNLIAKGLAAINPHWDDETLFQEARRINIAIIQQITYNEFLPILLGKEIMEKFGLVLTKEGYWDGYDPKINPSIIDSFAAASFRFGHSLLPTAVERWSKAHKFISSKRLSDLIRRPFDLYRAGVFDEYLMGLMNQVAQAMDDSITQEVTNHLFKKDGNRFGMDLVSFNMQRGREFGVPGYMEFRKFCGLSVANTWEEMAGTMTNETIYRYQSIFEHPADIDLWSGGVSEKSLPGSMLGPTFACIIATQMSYTRRGDRFWYELPNQPSSFTPEQLQEIRKAKFSRVICDNTDLIDTVQIYPMVLPDHEINPRVPCKSGIIPTIDLTKWADYPTGLDPQQFNILNEIPNTVDLISNELRRRKRRASRGRDAGGEDHHIGPDDAERRPLPTPRRRPKRVKIFEHYESKRTKARTPSFHNASETYTETETETIKEKPKAAHPKRRGKFTYDATHRKPESDGSDATDGDEHNSEIDDLNDDDFFYEQLEKRKPPMESSDEVEEVKDEQPNVNRDVVFVHGLNHNKRRGKQRQKFAQISSDAAILADINDDTYDDYGEMELPDTDVEMHDTYEQNTKEGQMMYGPPRPGFEQRPPPYVSPKWRAKNPLNPALLNARPNGPMYGRPGPPPLSLRPGPAPINTRPIPLMNAPLNAPLNARPKPSINAPRPAAPINTRPAPLAFGSAQNNPKIVPIDRPVHKQTFERITITKKLKTPDELHEEIDKIFQMKTENYNKKGHDKSHWELRIVPLRYKTHEEYGNN